MKGFTLIELIITITIVGVFSIIFIGSRGSYASQLLLKNETYNVALLLREAQVNSLAVKGFNNGASANFNTSYGVMFSVSFPTQFVLFTDENKNGRYDGPDCNGSCGPLEQAKTISLPSAITIQKVCSTNIGGGGFDRCSPMGNLAEIDVVFKRPKADASIRFLKDNGVDDPPSLPTAKIYLVHTNGKTSIIEISPSGLITVPGI